MEKVFDVAVVGAGVVGASIFNKLTRLGKSVLMLDKASDVATGASKANSGIVHAGYDPKPNSLKARLNVRGSKLYPKICKRLGVKLNVCGALVVGDDFEKIKALYERGLQNGVVTEIWGQDKIREKVPQINENITTALFAPNSAIVSPYMLTISLTEEGILNGGTVKLEQDITSIKKTDEFYEINTKTDIFKAKAIVNSAGAGYNEIAKLLGAEEYPLEFRRGEYFVFDKVNDLDVPCTIFPLPTKIGKGVLVTPTIDGNYLVGPTSEECDGGTETTFAGLKEVKEKSMLNIPTLNFKNAIREFAGVRVISGDDFIVEKSKIATNVVNIAGICSPGLTSAPAIAEMVVRLLKFSNIELKNLAKIEPYKMFKDMSKAQQKLALEKDKDYAKVVCKCEKITKGDITFALNRPLKVRSVDAIKRRTNAGMGRCQGGFCFAKVVSEIAIQRKIDYTQVLKENRGSEVIFGDIREVTHD